MIGSVGVAISTTGERDELLQRAEQAWWDVGVHRVVTTYDRHRRGVAVNKNRGLKFLMERGCEHLFLADDDMYPLSREAWERYVQQPIPHLSLSWGGHRLVTHDGTYSRFTWPRGVMLYLHRSVVEAVGGMRTEYPNAHEHVDLSRRIHKAGLTPYPYMDLDQNVRDWFHCEDQPRPGERRHEFTARKRRNSTIRRTTRDSKRIAELWEQFDGDTSFVEYR